LVFLDLRLQCTALALGDRGLSAQARFFRLSDLERKFNCKACGRRCADVRPLFE
jgi:hypothetical protein